MQLLARRTGLVQVLSDQLTLLRHRVPYHESDHVLNIAYDILCNADCLKDIKRLCNDGVFPDALGSQQIPDRTTAGDNSLVFRLNQPLRGQRTASAPHTRTPG